MLAALRVKAENIEDRMVRIQDVSLPIGCVPLLIEGVVDRWPAMENWSRERLTAAHGTETVECFAAPRAQSGFLQQTSERRPLSFADFLAHTFSDEPTDELLYLRIDAGHPIFESLASDFEIPSILDRYQPAATGIWIGQRGNITPFHHDWWHSFLAQVCGRKRYVLIHPLEAHKLQRGWGAAARFDLEEAPEFDREISGRFSMGFEGILEPGQLLYIPPYWLHQIDTLDNGNISMPIRFDTDQSPDVDLFQLSQDSTLRRLTNQPVSDAGVLVEILRENRARFARSELEFVEAFRAARGLEESADEIRHALLGDGSRGSDGPSTND